MELEQYLTGDLEGEAKAAFERQIAADPELAERIRVRQAEKQEFLLDPRRRRFAELVDEAEKETPFLLQLFRGRLGPLGLGLAVVAAVALAVVFVPRPTDQRGIEIKGGVSVQVAIADGSGRPAVPYESGQPLHPGDRLRLSIDDAKGGYLTVLLEEEKGRIDVLYRAEEIGRLPPGRHALPGSLRLDDRLGRERIYVLLAPEPADEEAWVRQISAAHRANGFDHGWLPAAPARIHTIDYEKGPR